MSAYYASGAVPLLQIVKRMKLLLVALFLAALYPCDAEVKTSGSIELLEFGTFKKLVSHEDVAAPGAIAGARHSVSKVKLIESTTNIVARVGMSFGFRVRMPGKATGVVVPCSTKCIHAKLTDPSSGRSSEVEQWDTSALAGEEAYIGYTFDNEWELVPGPWTIQVFMDSKLMIEKTFNVNSASKN